jgi:hypothetical protein
MQNSTPTKTNHSLADTRKLNDCPGRTAKIRAKDNRNRKSAPAISFWGATRATKEGVASNSPKSTHSKAVFKRVRVVKDTQVTYGG